MMATKAIGGFRKLVLKAIVIAACLASNPTVVSALELAVTDVTVVDTRTGALAPHRTVLIRDGRIA